MCGSSSSNTSRSTTTNQDRSAALNAGGFAFSGDTGGSITVVNSTTDAGVVSRALDTVDVANATNGEGFTKLLTTAEKLFTASNDTVSGIVSQASEQASKLAGQVQQSVAAAYSDAQNNAKGTIDNRTIIVLAVAGAAALVISKRKG